MISDYVNVVKPSGVVVVGCVVVEVVVRTVVPTGNTGNKELASTLEKLNYVFKVRNSSSQIHV